MDPIIRIYATWINEMGEVVPGVGDHAVDLPLMYRPGNAPYGDPFADGHLRRRIDRRDCVAAERLRRAKFFELRRQCGLVGQASLERRLDRKSVV